MGHTVNADREYRLLQQRLDRNVTGAPDSPVFMKILRILFTPAEAEIARRVPTSPVTLEVLSRKLGIPLSELDEKMTIMADKGLVMDMELAGQKYFCLAPVVIGFFEFTFMRASEDMPMKELAELFEQYMSDDDKFITSVMREQTQLARALVREESLPVENAISLEDYSEVLDWERASWIIKTASQIGVSRCQCRHKAEHLGKECAAPQEVCLSFNWAAQYTTKHGFARPISGDEALRILEKSKEAGLAQIGDNVKSNISYICNCCGCCCGLISGMKRFNIANGVITSNRIMEVAVDRCRGCGKCARVCPLDAIDIINVPETGKRASCRQELCLGCGVCYSACSFGGIVMKPREKRVYTPETTFDRIVSMAIERGKLANLLFEDPESLSYKALGRVVSILENSPPFRAAMAVKPLRSVFLSAGVRGAKLKAGRVSDLL